MLHYLLLSLPKHHLEQLTSTATLCDEHRILRVLEILTKEDANLRSTAQVVDGNVIMSIKRGAVVELLSESKTWGGSCNSGWYNVSYAGSIGYVCSGYVVPSAEV